MDVAIAGAHGRIGRLLTRRLRERGDRVRGLIRNPDHREDVRADGGEPVVCDLETAGDAEIADAVRGADAVVFAAGAGPGSGPERKRTVDRDGAIRLLRAAEAAGVARYLMVSAVGAERAPEEPSDDDVFAVYLRAKADADAALGRSDLRWTILRPGGLTDDPGRERVRVDTEPYRGEIPRADVAAALDAVLHEVSADGRVLYLNGGEEPIVEALERAA